MSCIILVDTFGTCWLIGPLETAVDVCR